jgi:hypothetical protein
LNDFFCNRNFFLLRDYLGLRVNSFTFRRLRPGNFAFDLLCSGLFICGFCLKIANWRLFGNLFDLRLCLDCFDGSRFLSDFRKRFDFLCKFFLRRFNSNLRL